MAELEKMYGGVANSPDTFLTSPLASGGTIMYLANGGVLGEIPNLAVLGSGPTAETVLVTEHRTDGGYTILRAVEGIAKDWPQATIVARNFTNYDYGALVDNIRTLNVEKVEIVQGKDLSDNNYTIEDKAKVDAIPENPKYTDTTYMVATTTQNGLMSSVDKTKIDSIEEGANNYQHPSSHSASMITESTTKRFVTDAEKASWNAKTQIIPLTQAEYDALSQAEKDRLDVYYGIYEV